MRRSTTIRSYLPVPEYSDRSLIIQARVSPKMKLQIKQIAKENNWCASQVIRAGLEKFLDDELPQSELFKAS